MAIRLYVSVDGLYGAKLPLFHLYCSCQYICRCFRGALPGWLSGERVGFMTWWLRVRFPVFFLAYFRLSPLQKYVRKVVGGFGKKSCVSTGVRKPGSTFASP